MHVAPLGPHVQPLALERQAHARDSDHTQGKQHGVVVDINQDGKAYKLGYIQ